VKRKNRSRSRFVDEATLRSKIISKNWLNKEKT